MNYILLLLPIFQCLQVADGDRRNAEVVYPERIHHTRSKRDLSTQLKEKKHEDSLTFRIKSKEEGDLVVDLKKDEPLREKLLLRTYADDGTPINKYHDHPNCFYTGSINNKRDSHAYVSACKRGLTGSLDTGTRRYDIEPHDTNDGHKFYNVDEKIKEIAKRMVDVEDELRDMMKAMDDDRNDDTVADDEVVSDEVVSDEVVKRGFSSGVKITRVDKEVAQSVRPFHLINVEKEYASYMTTDLTRYVEMFVSVDHGMYKHYKDTDVIIERVLNAVGQVDVSYSAIGIRLVVVAIEIQNNGDTFPRSYTNGGLDLRYFQRHYVKVRQEEGFKDIRMDNAQLFSNHDWGSVAGMGFVGTMCSSASAAVSVWNYESISGPVVVFGHELGHNFGFLHHRSDTCNCLTTRGCFMGGGSVTGRPGFSDCNLRKLASKVYTCLNDRPMNPLTSKCGNGIQEEGEECDCGTPENCAKVDPCCKPHGCILKVEAQCNFLNNAECCEQTCQFKQQGTICREAASNCDVPEYCSGEAATCPDDRIAADGTACGESKKLLLGTYKYKLETRELRPPITGRYFKFIPKHWTKNGQACMKLELLGCGPSQDTSEVPTSITTPPISNAGYAMCLVPSAGTCDDTPDGTQIIYKKAEKNSCTDSNMMFIHRADGTLIHHCSQKKVCPVFPVNPRKPVNLTISSTCEDEASKFTRTKKLSLQHIATKRCLTSTSWGGPKDGVDVVLKPWCDLAWDMSKFFLRNVDCATPLGLEDGRIDDAAISAGPSDHYYPAKDIRMNKDGWCAKSKTEGSWLQLDMGEIVEVRYIEMQGIFYWISGYHLMYSDNGLAWTYYKESSDVKTEGLNSVCFGGTCALTYDHQCQKLWDADANSASYKCWNKLNADRSGYGTCNPVQIIPCATSNVMCGQLQCTSPSTKPYFENYGKDYITITEGGEKCSAAKIVDTGNDEVGAGMVQDGTKCGDGKICINHACKTPQEHGKKTCGLVNGILCGGGYCMDNGICQCNSGYNPDDDCATEMAAIDGKLSQWSEWSECTKACDAGAHRRHRFCNSPSAKHGGKDCVGERVEEEKCNEDACPVGHTCKDIHQIMKENGQKAHDGVYTIKPSTREAFVLKVYCDMTRNGGGWTLLVSSHNNDWTAANVLLRNEDKPGLYNDYSIIKYANALKNDIHIQEDTFEYRLEAEHFGMWGGIWEAPTAYSLSSTNKDQEDVKLLKKFGDWEYSGSGIQKRLPYIYKQKLTTSSIPQWHSRNVWGTITDDDSGARPSRWISGKQKMSYPEHIWYWLREGDYSNPKSCLDLMFRGFEQKKDLFPGVYKIEPVSGQAVETYCEMERHGGGWTLLLKTSEAEGWSPDNILTRNSNNVAADDYSILELAKLLKGKDPAEKSFYYMIEADGDDKNGGIFSLPIAGSFETGECANVKPTVVKKFGEWDENVEGIAKYPLCPQSATGSVQLVKQGGDYMTTYKHPKNIKVWIREAGSRKSCNDVRIHGYHNGKSKYSDGFYMVRDMQPVYCDMTTSTGPEGWTLLLTSANSGWTMEQVKLRDATHPSLYHDYSILSQGDAIKSLSHANYFKYMLSAEARNHWGGIWKAPIQYSFTSTSNKYTNVELIEKFDNWDYEHVKYYQGPSKRMPWLDTKPSNQNGLLNTASSSRYYGAVVSKVSRYDPSAWITQKMNPGFIWYWVNENDCDPDYAKVDAGYSTSSWSPCSASCNEVGIRYRFKSCDNPAPRCGGNPCDPALEKREEQSCRTTCTASQVQTPDGHFCFEPESGGCSPADGTKVVLRPRPSQYCRGDESLFLFNPDKGEITHKCSMKRICFLNGGEVGDSLLISAQCPQTTPKYHFFRTQFDSIYYGNLVVHPVGGYSASLKGGIGNGNTLQLKDQPKNRNIEQLVLTDETYNPGLNGDARCNFSSPDAPGDGIGGTEVEVEDVGRGIECVNACIEEKKKDDSINGVTVTPYDENCWCEKGMNGRNTRKDLRSCYLDVSKPAGTTKKLTGNGPVKSLYWDKASYSFYQTDKRFPSNPTAQGYIDSLETPAEFSYRYAFQLSSYFVPRQSGNYVFKASCDDKCQLFLSEDEDPSKKKAIVEVTRATGRYQWDKIYQSSDNIHLHAGKRYYIEALMLQMYGDCHMEIGVVLPNGVLLEPVTSAYLSK